MSDTFSRKHGARSAIFLETRKVNGAAGAFCRRSSYGFLVPGRMMTEEEI
ncbi:hypothetical protein [Chelativorans alearense]|nr:hypothetical protein [Chelativorans alearense]